MQQVLADLVVEETADVLPTQRSDGSFPPGQNGPYEDPETPARNTSHWLVTLSRLTTDKFSPFVTADRQEEFRAAAERAVGYLMSDVARPGDATVLHRTQAGKDRCNGLIGQAWTIEALVTAAEVFDRTDLIDLAAELFLLHPFNERVALWQRVDTDGSVLGFDRTFNHQLWFAAAGAELAAHHGGRVDGRVSRFLSRLPQLLDTTERGLIRHLLRPDFALGEYVDLLFDSTERELWRNKLLHRVRPPSNKRLLRRKAVGYHSFNLYGLAMLSERYPNHPVWQTDRLSSALEYATSDLFRRRLDGNPYGYPYNCSGIELAYALSTFGLLEEAGQQRWLTRQFARTYDPESETVMGNTPDPATLTARLYETTRLDKQALSLEVQVE